MSVPSVSSSPYSSPFSLELKQPISCLILKPISGLNQNDPFLAWFETNPQLASFQTTHFLLQLKQSLYSCHCSWQHKFLLSCSNSSEPLTDIQNCEALRGNTQKTQSCFGPWSIVIHAAGIYLQYRINWTKWQVISSVIYLNKHVLLSRIRETFYFERW